MARKKKQGGQGQGASRQDAEAKRSDQTNPGGRISAEDVRAEDDESNM